MAAKVRNMLPFDPTDEDQLPGPEELREMKGLAVQLMWMAKLVKDFGERKASKAKKD